MERFAMRELARLVESAPVDLSLPAIVAPGDAPAVYSDARAVALALVPDEPVHLFSEAELNSRLAKFQNGFPGMVSYAVKCNDGTELLAALGRAGLKHYDVASVYEMESVAAHVPDAHFHYHNPVKSRDEITRAYWRFGVRRFAVDDIAEVSKLAAVLPTTAGVEIAVRFRLPKLVVASGDATVAHDFTSKFGASEEEAAELLVQSVELGFTPVLTFHPGSQCMDPGAYRRHILAAGRIATQAGVPVAALNVGGGFPSDYVGLKPVDLSVYFDAIRQAAAEAFGDAVPALECEPGRGLVATCMSVLARVKAVRPRTAEIFINDGVYGSLMEVYQAPTLLPSHRVIRNGVELVESFTPHIVYGPTCDPLDRLPGMMAVPADIEEGDFIEFGGLGAYGEATSTRFNGYGAAAVIPVTHVLGN
jgi:ornithine decarboxylase